MNQKVSGYKAVRITLLLIGGIVAVGLWPSLRDAYRFGDAALMFWMAAIYLMDAVMMVAAVVSTG